MKINNKKLTLSLTIILTLLTVIILACILLLNISSLKLKQGHQSVEINSIVDYTSYIEEVKNGKIEDVIIDSSQVKTDILGKYTVYYTYKDKTQQLSLNVVDTIAPSVEIKELSVLKGTQIKVEDLITSIKDETKTIAAFEKEYDFTKEGQYDVTIIVEDEGKNKTTVKTTVEILVDKKAPVITASDFKVTLNSSVNLKDRITVKDDFDSTPTITVDKGDFTTSKEGTYTVKYIAKDDTGNVSEAIVSITVYKPVADGTKIIYLTFDDGPSNITASILDTLKKYNVKATFFVCGKNGSGGIESKYAYLTKRAYEEGHTIALHSYTHDYKTIYKSNEAFLKDLEKLSDSVEKLIGIRPKLFRFPGGSNNGVYNNYGGNISSMKSLIKFMHSKGYEYYDWNADSTDASGNNIAVSKIIKNSTGYKMNKINLLMHDTGAKKTTAQALPSIIEHYLERGYEFRGIDDSYIPQF